MEYEKTAIPGVILLQPKVLGDDRGFFMETYRADEVGSHGIVEQFVQDNHSGSKQGILRGLHYQIRHSQGKLLRVISGEIFDVAVDMRQSSTTFGKWVSVVLSFQNKKQIWIPPGFAHGYYVLSEWAEVVYKSTDYYAPNWERSLIWNDPILGITWPLLDGKPPILSEKDAHGRKFSEAEKFN
jgi:dTDP-4-dehydrorhamnose 3,5-epimerase